MRLLALDGTDTIGGTKLLLNYDGLGVMLDFGLNYSVLSRYYEEYKKLPLLCWEVFICPPE